MDTCTAKPSAPAGEWLRDRVDRCVPRRVVEWHDRDDVIDNHGGDGLGIYVSCTAMTVGAKVEAHLKFVYHGLNVDDRLFDLTSICEEVVHLLHERLD